VIHREDYRLKECFKIRANIDQRWPAIILTPQDYDENQSSAARTSKSSKSPSLIPHLPSLFSIFDSLIRVIEFPVKFLANETEKLQTAREHWVQSPS